MKIRDSGMPDEATWTGFFDPMSTLRRLQFTADAEDVVDFGCGYGTFSIAAAQLTAGIVHALDLDPRMISATAANALRQGLTNVKPVERDFVNHGTGLAGKSTAYAMLFNILHAEDPVQLLREAFRVLHPGGVVAVTHWIHDIQTPRGPALGIRPRPEQCLEWLRTAGFVPDPTVVALPPYHFGVVARRPLADTEQSTERTQ
jgi:SAM-dependent methyltransferase